MISPKVTALIDCVDEFIAVSFFFSGVKDAPVYSPWMPYPGLVNQHTMTKQASPVVLESSPLKCFSPHRFLFFRLPVIEFLTG